jgi:hypothetical protein
MGNAAVCPPLGQMPCAQPSAAQSGRGAWRPGSILTLPPSVVLAEPRASASGQRTRTRKSLLDRSLTVAALFRGQIQEEPGWPPPGFPCLSWSWSWP